MRLEAGEVRRFLKRSAAFVGRRMRGSPSGIRVLGYHRIGESSVLQMDIPRSAFDEQLRELRSRGPFLSLADAIDASRDGSRPSGAVLTFDDGYAETFENCVPIFRELKIAGTFYLSTADIQRGWIPTSAGPAEAIRLADVQDLAKDPLFTFGSHGHSHRVLVRMSDAEIRNDLITSRSLVEEWTGRPVLHFAYPRGLWDERVERIVRTLFRSAVRGGSRPLEQRTDLHRISRYPIQASDDIDVFRSKLDGALFLEDAARSMRDRLDLATGRVPER
jgi:peptidoglycan/xylan/chitin deacetylase (PgdA/CDA1 family)